MRWHRLKHSQVCLNELDPVPNGLSLFVPQIGWTGLGYSGNIFTVRGDFILNDCPDDPIQLRSASLVIYLPSAAEWISAELIIRFVVCLLAINNSCFIHMHTFHVLFLWFVFPAGTHLFLDWLVGKVARHGLGRECLWRQVEYAPKIWFSVRVFTAFWLSREDLERQDPERSKLHLVGWPR